jgi:hypothetical protein
VTFVGVLVGAFLGLWVERQVALLQLKRTKEEEEWRDREHLLAHIDRVKLELRDNGATVKQLQRTLDKSPSARVDLFRFALRLAAALSVSAYEDLARSGLQRYLSWEAQSDLFDARQRTVGLKAMVEAGEPAVEFYLGFSADQNAAGLHLDNTKTYANSVLDGLERCKKMA